MKYTEEEFIEKFYITHSGKYNYHNVLYNDTTTKISIVCKIHGEFLQTPTMSEGCPKCAGSIVTNNNFIKKAVEKHGSKYDYSKTNYINTKTKVTITCKVHGDFSQFPNTHILSFGCSKCSRRCKLTNEEFQKKSHDVHGFRYLYHKVNYINNSTKVIIICEIHGDFLQKPSSHLAKNGCPACADNTSNTEVFINKSNTKHQYKYCYNKSNYINQYTKVIIMCPSHGEFLQIPKSHINGAGCPKCNGGVVLTNSEFKIKAITVHGDLYDYNFVNYINAQTKIKIICSKHGVFLQTPNNHLNNKGCPKCKMSKGELEINKWLVLNNIKFISQHKYIDCKNINLLSFDFYLPDYNLLIEYDGEQHYKNGVWNNLEKTQINDKIKNKYCEDNNIKLLRIPYTDFNNIEYILLNNIK